MKVESSKSLQRALRDNTYVDFTWQQAGAGQGGAGYEIKHLTANQTLVILHQDTGTGAYSIACGRAVDTGPSSFEYHVLEGDYYAIHAGNSSTALDAIVLFSDDESPILVANIDELTRGYEAGLVSQEDDEMSRIYYEGGLDVPSIIDDDENID